METQIKELDENTFHKLRPEVLCQWKTGKDVDFNEAARFYEGLPQHKLFSERLKTAKENCDTLVQPRAGVAVPELHIKLLKYLEEQGGADLLPTTIDSYTRHNRYKEAEIGIEESIKTGKSALNGFAAVNHGVGVCRRVIESVNIPVQIRHGTPDARLLAEITLAGGFTSFEGGPISYNIPYSKNIPLSKTIYDWQYVDRLVGMYRQAGITINREPFGPLTGTLVPPCISHAVAILESLLAAEQGVSDITVGYGQSGNLMQDIAAIKTLEKLTEKYLKNFGFNNIFITTVLHQWMGGFPQDEANAFGVISWGAVAAVLSGATKVIVKTPHEAMGIPTMEANSQGLKTTKQLVTMLKDQKMTETQALSDEMSIISAETECIVDKVFELGKGSIAAGIVNAFEAGVIDIPFSPSIYNHGKVLPARDNNGAIRFLDFGNLPFTDSIKDFHKRKLDKRAKSEKRDVCFQMVIDDIYAISKGRLIGRPK